MGLVSGNRLNRFWKKGVKPIKDAIGVLTALSTVDKETLVGAINELADGKFDVAKLVASTNITEPGFAMDGKTASEAFAELYSKKGTRKKDFDTTTHTSKNPYIAPESGIFYFGGYPSTNTGSIVWSIGGICFYAQSGVINTNCSCTAPVIKGDPIYIYAIDNFNLRNAYFVY